MLSRQANRRQDQPVSTQDDDARCHPLALKSTRDLGVFLPGRAFVPLFVLQKREENASHLITYPIPLTLCSAIRMLLSDHLLRHYKRMIPRPQDQATDILSCEEIRQLSPEQHKAVHAVANHAIIQLTISLQERDQEPASTTLPDHQNAIESVACANFSTPSSPRNSS